MKSKQMLSSVLNSRSGWMLNGGLMKPRERPGSILYPNPRGASIHIWLPLTSKHCYGASSSPQCAVVCNRTDAQPSCGLAVLEQEGRMRMAARRIEKKMHSTCHSKAD